MFYPIIKREWHQQGLSKSKGDKRATIVCEAVNGMQLKKTHGMPIKEQKWM